MRKLHSDAISHSTGSARMVLWLQVDLAISGSKFETAWVQQTPPNTLGLRVHPQGSCRSQAVKTPGIDKLTPASAGGYRPLCGYQDVARLVHLQVAEGDGANLS